MPSGKVPTTVSHIVPVADPSPSERPVMEMILAEVSTADLK